MPHRESKASKEQKAEDVVTEETNPIQFTKYRQRVKDNAIKYLTTGRHSNPFMRWGHRMIIITITTIIICIILAISTFMMNPEAVQKAVENSINAYISQTERVSRLEVELASLNTKMAEAIIERLNSVKNPSLEGIVVKTVSGITVIEPKSLPYPMTRVHQSVAEWASSNGYDSVLFGVVSESLSGLTYWTNYSSENETDMGLIVERLRKKGLKKTLGFVSNVSEIHLPKPFDQYMIGKLTVKEVPVYLFGFCWDTGDTKVLISSKNISGSVINGTTNLKMYDTRPISIISTKLKEGKQHLNEWKKAGYLIN